jgi:hypothetical protein
MKADQEFMKEEMLTKMDATLYAHHESMMAKMESQLEEMKTAVDVAEERLNKMDTTDL